MNPDPPAPSSSPDQAASSIEHPASEIEKPKSKPLRRWGIGMNVAFQLLLCVMLFAVANYLGYRHWERRDLSPNADYTLADSTKAVLDNLRKDVEITVLFMRDSAIMPDVRALVEEFRRAKKSRIRTDEIDPARDVERAEQLKVKYKVPLKGNGILIRANNRLRFIPEDEMVLKGTSRERDNPGVEFSGEGALISAINSLVEGGSKRFYFVAGKGATAQAGNEMAYLLLAELGKHQNFEVLPIRLTEEETVPEDANGLLIIGAKYDFAEREMELLRAYWERKRAALLVLLDPAGETPKLREFLKDNGVTPRRDRVLYAESTSAGPRKQFSVQTWFLLDSPISQPFAEVTSVFSGQTQSLELNNDSALLRNRQILVTPLMEAADRFWGETQFTEDLPMADSADTVPPVHVAASVERGAVNDNRMRVDSARMVVVGNASMLDPATRLGVHQDFIAASLNWMLNRDKVEGPLPKVKNIFRIQLTEEQRQQIFWVTCLLMPIAVLGLGLLVWTHRRA